MKAVLMSIQPKWCELIANGKKTVEVRKTKPKLETPFKVFIYETKAIYKPLGCKHLSIGVGKVIGEFVCDAIIRNCEMANADIAEQQGCIKRGELLEYAGGKELYGWHISDLVIYDKPKELSEYKKINRHCWYADLGLAKRDCPECQNEDCFIQRPPQSWCYVEELGA